MGMNNPGKMDIPLNERLIMALDVGDKEEAKDWVKKLEGRVSFYKIGLQLFLSGWFEITEWIVERGNKVFVDLKFFDVPETVRLAVKQLRGRNITFTSVHGNEEMIKAACDEKNGVKILAVTVLTSLDDNDLKDLGFECSAQDLVLSRARRSLRAGCDGVISSGLETRKLRDEFGNGFIIVNPGIRPVENRDIEADDQKRVVDVAGAFRNGADYIVMGRPIRNAADPLKFVDQVFSQIKSGLDSE